MFQRPKRPTHTIDMAPLIDVVFLLLIFFMLTSSFVPPSIPLELPSVANSESTETPSVVVSMESDGRAAIGDVIVDDAGFEAALGAALTAASTRTVLFRGDQEADYGRFLELMARARKAGASSFHLVHRPQP